MKRKKFAWTVLVISVLLIIANVWNAYPGNFDTGFYLRLISNILILLSMIISVYHKKEKRS